jgi:hypothetical protein
VDCWPSINIIGLVSYGIAVFGIVMLLKPVVPLSLFTVKETVVVIAD